VQKKGGVLYHRTPPKKLGAEAQEKHRAMSSAIPQKNLPLSDAVIGALLDSVPDAILIVDQERRIILVNSQTEKLFG
jgi:PAS domain-containing protein